MSHPPAKQSLLIVGVVLLAATLPLATAAGAPAGQSGVRWIARDLGGFGGANGGATDLNERGQVVGYSATTITTDNGRPRLDAFLWEDGRLRNLGVHPPGFTANRALAINEQGQVLGLSTKDDEEGEIIAARLWLWKAGHVRTILTSRYEWIDGIALNDRGQVILSVGVGPDSAFFWQNGSLTRIGGPETSVSALNNRGQVVGTRPHGQSGSRAFLWQAGKMTDLGTLGGRNSSAGAINDRGQIVGSSETRRTAQRGVDARSHAFVWQAGRMTDLGTLGGPLSFPSAINDRGEVIGTAATGRQQRGSFVLHVFHWQDGTMTDIDPPGLGLRLGDWDEGSYPIAINSQGQTVTYRFCCGDSKIGFVWEDGGTTRLGRLSGKGWSEPAAINDHGIVVGFAHGSNGESRPALWQRQGA
jgi:probable HAF family extracellular repeat protein